MIDPEQLLNHIIRPVLMAIGLHSQDAERLVLGTACQESECGRWLVQLGGGPALGVYQMEESTEYDLIKNFIRYRVDLHQKMMRFPRYAEIYEQVRLEEIHGSGEGQEKS